jgi:hypothetical protein
MYPACRFPSIDSVVGRRKVAEQNMRERQEEKERRRRENVTKIMTGSHFLFSA